MIDLSMMQKEQWIVDWRPNIHHLQSCQLQSLKKILILKQICQQMRKQFQFQFRQQIREQTHEQTRKQPFKEILK